MRAYEWRSDIFHGRYVGDRYWDVTVEVCCGSTRRTLVGWTWSASRYQGWSFTKARAVRAVESRVTWGK